MRRWTAVLLALSAVFWSADSRACDCPGQPHPVKPHLVKHWGAGHRLHRHATAHVYSGCPIALAHNIRPGCNGYYVSYVGLR